MNRPSLTKNLHLFVWGAFLLMAAVFSVSLVLKIELVPRSAQKTASILFFSGFLFAISAAEIVAGEIHNRWGGPPKATRVDTPTRYWSQIAVQLLIATGLISILFLKS